MPLKPNQIYYLNQSVGISPIGEPPAPVNVNPESFLGVERYTPTFSAIYQGLGLPPHLHCPDCHGQDFGGSDVPRCARCEARPAMLVCTPDICASS